MAEVTLEHVNKHYGDQLFKIAYHKASPTWTLPQLFWIMRNEPELIEKTKIVTFNATTN